MTPEEARKRLCDTLEAYVKLSEVTKLLDVLLAEQEALLTVLGGKLYTEDDVPDVETTIARVPVWVVPA